MFTRPFPVTIVILAGGLGRRIGGDKGLQKLHGKALISWVQEAVSRDSEVVLINANDAQGRYAQFACRVIPDQLPNWPGPLAGLHAGLLEAKTEYVMTVPCDTPFLPDNLVARLFETENLAKLEAVVAVTEGRRQATIALYHKNVLPKLLRYLGSGKRKVNEWLDSLLLAEVAFDHVSDFDNINSQEDLARAHKIAMTTGLSHISNEAPRSPVAR